MTDIQQIRALRNRSISILGHEIRDLESAAGRLGRNHWLVTIVDENRDPIRYLSLGGETTTVLGAMCHDDDQQALRRAKIWNDRFANGSERAIVEGTSTAHRRELDEKIEARRVIERAEVERIRELAETTGRGEFVPQASSDRKGFELDGACCARWLESLGLVVVRHADLGTQGAAYTECGLVMSTNGYLALAAK